MLIERRPSPALSPFVARLWAMSPEPQIQTAAPRREHVLPTGHMHLVFRLQGAPLRILEGVDGRAERRLSAAAIVGGVRSSFYVREMSTPSHSVGVLLQPGAALALLGAREDELAGRHTELGELWGSAADSVVDQLACATALHRQIDMLESLLTARLPAVHGMHPVITAALCSIAAGAEVAEAVGRSGFSHRHFGALFRQTTGLAPKSYGRVMRFQRALRKLGSHNERDLAMLALEAGYCDQSHFNRDFRQFTGVTPTTYRQLAPVFSHHLVLRDLAGANA
jgi:AraC-like DNA-binding protein